MKTINLTNNEEVKKRNKSENINNELKKNNIYLINYINNPNLQINLINNLYLDNDFPEKKYILDELKIKLNSYKQQDKKKYNESNNLITLDNIIEKLVCSKLKCYYCMNDVNILYKDLKQKNQWTLDRIDNDIGHNTDNVVISCLKCNLDRGTKDINKFNFTKKLKLIKTNNHETNNHET